MSDLASPEAEQEKPNTPENGRKQTRVLLTKLFSVSLIFVIAVFVAVTLLSFSRLIDFRSTLSNITKQSMPTLVFSGRVFSQVNGLMYLTEGLSKLNSEAGLLIVEKQINMQLNKLQQLAETEFADPYLKIQLRALKIELDELMALIRTRLKVRQDLTQSLERLYQFYDGLLAEHTSLNESGNWTLLVAETVAMAGKVTTMTRLYEIRQTAGDMQRTLTLLQKETEHFPKEHRELVEGFNKLLESMLLADDGVVELRVKQLRIEGRARGRSNFLSNLILDYANLAEYQSFEVNDSVMEQAHKTTTQVDEQIKLIAIVSGFALLFLLCVVLFLQTQFISRLKQLDKLVKQHLTGKEADITISGNDEISDIANTFNSFVDKIEQQNEILQALSLSDGLTGIANRRALDERLLYTLNLGQRHLWPTTIMLLDVDYFKKFNDLHGHAKGDDCLVEVATILSTLMQRENDFVARYGGEEFVCVLGETDTQGAIKVAERVIAAMARSEIPHGSSKVADYVTLSIGVVTYYPTRDEKAEPLELLKRADKALYKAKDNGRNTFVVGTVS